MKGILLSDLSEEKLREIGYVIGDSMFAYNYSEEKSNSEIGYRYFFDTRQKMQKYAVALVKKGYKCDSLYTTSEKEEGYIIVTLPGKGIKHLIYSLQEIIGIVLILGVKKSILLMKYSNQGGKSYDIQLLQRGEKYMVLDLLVVRNEYKGMHYMKRLMDLLYEIADQNQLSIYCDTDSLSKCMRYEKYGMTHVGMRGNSKEFRLYDLYRKHI